MPFWINGIQISTNELSGEWRNGAALDGPTDGDIWVNGALLGVFSPLSLSPALWFKADTGTFQDSSLTTAATANTDPVGGWADQSGNAKNATQGTAGARGTLRLNVQNGLPVVRMDGIDDHLALPANGMGTNTDTAKTVFVACSTPTIGTSDPTVIGTANGFLFRTRSITQYRSAAGAATVLGGQLDSAAFVVQTFRHQGTSITRRLNGSQTDAGSPATTTGRWGDTTYFCRGDGATGTTVHVYDVGEIIVYNAALTNSECAQVEAYLKSRWGTP